MSQQARSALMESERQARMRILTEFQALQQRLKTKFGDLLSQIESQRTLTGSVPVSFLFERDRLATLLSDVALEIKAIMSGLAAAVTDAQSTAIDVAAIDTERLIQTVSGKNQIVRFNPQAAKELIGNTQTGVPLGDFLERLTPPVQDAVKNALIDGVANGSSSRAVAAQINTALGTGAAQALAVARTEQNQAYRQAAVSHYRENSDLVKGYIWLAACDLRTCIICWSRHGLIFALNKKPQSHVNCRCTFLPYQPEMELPETGESQFAKLTKQQQIEILGKGRADLYDQGLRLEHFVSEKQTNYGATPFIKNLADLPDPALIRKPVVPPVAPKPVQVVPKTPKTAPVAAVAQGQTSEQAMIKLKELKAKADQTVSTFKKAGDDAFDQWRKHFDSTQMLKEYRAAKNLPDGSEIDVLDYDQFRKDWRDTWQAKQTEFYELETAAKVKFKAEQLKVVQVDQPSKLKAVFAKGFSAEEKNIIQTGVDEFAKLVSDEFLSAESFTYKKTRDKRSFYTERTINLSARARTEKGRSTVIHETAHGLEILNQKILDSAVRFYEHRTKGESFVRLAQVTKIKSYGSEMCKVDKFTDPYDGKKPYNKFVRDANGRWQDTGVIEATEIITRGMEYIWQDPAKFAADQPEYFDFIYRVLRGESWQPKSS